VLPSPCAGNATQGGADGRAGCRPRRANPPANAGLPDEAVALSDRVVVFSARPGRIKTIVPIAMDRSRNLFSRECEKLRTERTVHLKDEVERAFAEQEAFAATA
jgi:hypothetical protein